MADPRTCEHVGLRARAGALRCLFCRQPVTDHPLRRVFACPGCGVLVHGLCARELEGDRCPTLGCAASPPWLRGQGALDPRRAARGVADRGDPPPDASRSPWNRRRLGGFALAAGVACLAAAALTPREPPVAADTGPSARRTRAPISPDLGPACRDPDIERAAWAEAAVAAANRPRSSSPPPSQVPDPAGSVSLPPTSLAPPTPLQTGGPSRARSGPLAPSDPSAPAGPRAPDALPHDLTGWIAVTRLRRLCAEDQRACLLPAGPGAQPGAGLIVASARVWWVASEELSQVVLTNQWVAEARAPQELIEVPAGTFRCWRRTRPWLLPGGASVPAQAWFAPDLDVPVRISLTWTPTPGAAPWRLEGELVRLLPPG